MGNIGALQAIHRAKRTLNTDNAHMTSPAPDAGSNPESAQPVRVSAHSHTLSDDRLTRAVKDTAELLSRASFPLRTLDAQAAEAERSGALNQIADYILPRVENSTAPLVAVVGGSTGAGKSTLINSVLGQRVTLPGALRPTTRSPVLVHNPNDAQWFISARILPGLSRELEDRAPGEKVHGEPATVGPVTSGLSTDQGSPGGALEVPGRADPHEPLPAAPTAASRQGTGHQPYELRLVSSDVLPQGLALIDSPDVDSIVDDNRALAVQLLAAADLWIFVTTAARYADAVPWGALADAAARQTQLAIVVDRVDPDAFAVVSHLRSMLDSHGLSSAPLFVVEEQELVDGLIPAASVEHVRAWLRDLMQEGGQRDHVIAATRNGAIASLSRTLEDLAVKAETQERMDATLRRSVEDAYARARNAVSAATEDGSMLRGEVLARWQDYIGTGEFMRSIERGISKFRDKVTGYLRGKQAAPAAQRAVGESLHAVVLEQCDLAAEQSFMAWRSNEAGADLLDDPSLMRASSGLSQELAAEIRDWQSTILSMVSDQGAEKRQKARALALGTNGLGLTLMVVVFASTSGITGAEAGIAGGTALAAQRVLEGVFGEDAVRGLANEARKDLDERVARVMEQERARFLDRLDAASVSKNLGASLRASSRELGAASESSKRAGGGAHADSGSSAHGPVHSGAHTQVGFGGATQAVNYEGGIHLPPANTEWSEQLSASSDDSLGAAQAKPAKRSWWRFGSSRKDSTR